jgi:hypothetical protein
MYRRSTRALTMAQLPPSLAVALGRHAEGHQLVLDAARVWLTHSENPAATSLFGKMFGRRANPLDPDSEHDSVLLLHTTHIVIATTGVQRGTSALSVPLAAASVVRGSALAAVIAAAAAGAYDGMTVSGFPGTEGRPGAYFFGLGHEPAAADCFAATVAAIAAAKA